MLIFVSGCGVVDWVFPEDEEPLPGDEDYEFQEPGEEEGEPDDDPTFGEAGTREVTLYFADNLARHIVSTTYSIPDREGIGQEVVRHLVEGGPAQDFLTNSGLKAVLPAGTQVIGMNIKDGLCTVDLSREFLNAADDIHEQLMLDSLVYSLTEFSTIDKVVLWIEGRPINELTHGTPVDAEMTRSRSLNLEPGAGYGSQVTIYVQLDNLAQPMLVPVTRTIAPATDLAGAALNQLIQGPMAGMGLSGVMPVTTEVRDFSVEGSTAIVDFSRDMAEADNLPLAVMAVVMTLTEFANVDDVKITISGQTIELPDGKLLSEPVMRPGSPNPLAF